MAARAARAFVELAGDSDVASLDGIGPAWRRGRSCKCGRPQLTRDYTVYFYAEPVGTIAGAELDLPIS